MNVIKVAYKNNEIQISRAKPALIQAGERAYWAFAHAHDGGKDGRLLLPVAGQAKPCPNRSELFAPGEATHCEICGTKHRRMDLGGNHESPLAHPDKGYAQPTGNYVMRRTRGGKQELVENDRHQGSSLVLLRPNGAWFSPSKGVHTMMTGVDGNDHIAPVLVMNHPSALVFGVDEKPVTGIYFDSEGHCKTCDAPTSGTATHHSGKSVAA